MVHSLLTGGGWSGTLLLADWDDLENHRIRKSRKKI